MKVHVIRLSKGEGGTKNEPWTAKNMTQQYSAVCQKNMLREKKSPGNPKHLCMVGLSALAMNLNYQWIARHLERNSFSSQSSCQTQQSLLNMKSA